MESVLILYCDIPHNLKKIRDKYDEHRKIPAHITICYLDNEYEKEKLENELKKTKKFILKLDKLNYITDEYDKNTFRLEELNSFLKSLQPQCVIKQCDCPMVIKPKTF